MDSPPPQAAPPAAKHVVVLYTLKADRLAEHEALLAAVFEALAEARPAGLTYEAWCLADGVSFVHVARTSGPDNPLTALPAFRAFTADIRSRCEVPPAAADGRPRGAYRSAP